MFVSADGVLNRYFRSFVSRAAALAVKMKAVAASTTHSFSYHKNGQASFQFGKVRLDDDHARNHGSWNEIPRPVAEDLGSDVFSHCSRSARNRELIL